VPARSHEVRENIWSHSNHAEGNAYKNLGLAQTGLGQMEAVAQSLMGKLGKVLERQHFHFSTLGVGGPDHLDIASGLEQSSYSLVEIVDDHSSYVTPGDMTRSNCQLRPPMCPIWSQSARINMATRLCGRCVQAKNIRRFFDEKRGLIHLCVCHIGRNTDGSSM
jgi:hypothetical protein